MSENRTAQTAVNSYISSLLREHFGKGPTSVYTTIQHPFLVIHVRDFLSPTEKILMRQNETQRILEIRDLLMNELQGEIKLQLWKNAGLDIVKLYADWDLERKTGVIFGVMEEEADRQPSDWPQAIDREAAVKEIECASIRGEKQPEQTEIHYLSDRTILVLRRGILVEIEKELIRNGFTEELKLAKRPLERRVFGDTALEQVFGRGITEIFVDWDFDDDEGYAVFLLAADRP